MSVTVITKDRIGRGLEIHQNRLRVIPTTAPFEIEREYPLAAPIELQVHGEPVHLDKLGKIRGMDWYVVGVVFPKNVMDWEVPEYPDDPAYPAYPPRPTTFSGWFTATSPNLGTNRIAVYFKTPEEIREAMRPILDADPGADNKILYLYFRRPEDGVEESILEWNTHSGELSPQGSAVPFTTHQEHPDDPPRPEGYNGPVMDVVYRDGEIPDFTRIFAVYGLSSNPDQIPYYVGKDAEGKIYTYDVSQNNQP